MDAPSVERKWSHIPAIPNPVAHIPNYVADIPNFKYIELVVRHLDPDSKTDLGWNCVASQPIRGAHHLIARIYAKGHGHFVVRVPIRGTWKQWKLRDAYFHKVEVSTMKYIREQSSVPVPKVVGYDNGVDNIIGTPYIIMEDLQGRPAWSTWFGTDSLRWDELSKDPISEAKRQKFLKSLAGAMAELGRLQFTQAGVLFEETGDVSPATTAPKFPAISTSKEFWKHHMDQHFGDRMAGNNFHRGAKLILEEISKLEPFATSRAPGEQTESFVLNHFNLNVQNILVDDDGNVTGITDWDSCLIVPRCIGPASLPAFLQPGYYAQKPEQRHGLLLRDIAARMKPYQISYSQYMIDAIRNGPGGAVGDGRFTLRSDLYRLFFEVLRGSSVDLLLYLISDIKAISDLKALSGAPFTPTSLVLSLGDRTLEIPQTLYLKEKVLPVIREGLADILRPEIPIGP
jgi:hypothetical protein